MMERYWYLLSLAHIQMAWNDCNLSTVFFDESWLKSCPLKRNYVTCFLWQLISTCIYFFKLYLGFILSRNYLEYLLQLYWRVKMCILWKLILRFVTFYLGSKFQLVRNVIISSTKYHSQQCMNFQLFTSSRQQVTQHYLILQKKSLDDFEENVFFSWQWKFICKNVCTAAI